MKLFFTLRIITTTILLSAGSFMFSQSQNDTLKIILKLKSVHNVLTFNQNHVTPNTLEYMWEIKINSDNNTQTGDNQGYDVGLAMVNIKFGTSQSYTGTIISGSDQHTLIYQGNTSSYGNQLTAVFNYADTSIIITGLRSWPELAAIDNNDSFYCSSYFNCASGIESDFTAPAFISSGITDQLNDVNTSFIDIKSVTFVSETPVGINRSNYKNTQLKIFPNPSAGKFYIDVNLQDLSLSVLNSHGIPVPFTQNINEIDLTGQMPGVYFLKIVSENSIINHKIILN